jgi:hypothetical protein
VAFGRYAKAVGHIVEHSAANAQAAIGGPSRTMLVAP